jgi:protein O-GlcNAc transferase
MTTVEEISAALERDPTNVAALIALGQVALRIEQPQRAIGFLERALRIAATRGPDGTSDLAVASSRLAEACLMLDRVEAAREANRIGLTLAAPHSIVRATAAALALLSGDVESAATTLDALRTASVEEAAPGLISALAAARVNGQQWLDAAYLCDRVGAASLALALYDAAATRNPDDPAPFVALIAALRASHRFDEALILADRLVERHPSAASGYCARGLTLQATERFEAAEVELVKALERAPRDLDVLMRLAFLAGKSGDDEGAIAYLDRALEVDPLQAIAHARRALVLPVIASSVEAIAAARSRVARAIDDLRAAGIRLTLDQVMWLPTPFESAYHGEDELPFQRRCAALYLQACPELAYRAPHLERGARRKRLRVGFCSRFLRAHVVARLYGALIERLDRERFEVVLIRPAQSVQDATSQALDRAADAAVALPSDLGRAQIALGKLELDVLVFTDIGIEEATYFLAFGRYARVQCSSWGHPVTSGIPTIDYYVSSRHLEIAAADAHYSERLVRFDQLPSYYARPEPEAAVGREALGLPAHRRLYGCPQSVFKIHPRFDAWLAAILRADPDGAVVMIDSPRPSYNQRLKARFARAMPDVIDRVCFVPPLSRARYTSLLHAVDVLLDPTHFGSGNTAYEGFAGGVPIVTAPGDWMRTRVTAGAYAQMGLEGLVAATEREYVELALRVATDQDFRQRWSRDILAGSSRLFSTASTITEWEQFFERTYDAARGA